MVHSHSHTHAYRYTHTCTHTLRNIVFSNRLPLTFTGPADWSAIRLHTYKHARAHTQEHKNTYTKTHTQAHSLSLSLTHTHTHARTHTHTLTHTHRSEIRLLLLRSFSMLLVNAVHQKGLLLKDAFELFDQSSNSTINLLEFYSGVRWLNITLTPGQCLKIFKCLDTTNARVLSLQQFGVILSLANGSVGHLTVSE